jgi:tetratricopeptide (TPR) repeat protein
LSIIQALWLLLMLSFYVETIHANTAELQEIPEGFTSLSEDEVLILQQIDDAIQRTSAIENLTIAKHYLIAGQTEMARFFINRVGNDKRAVELVKKRYMAVINIMENDFKEAKDILSDPSFSEIAIYPQVCLMKILTLLGGPADSNLEQQMSRCQSEIRQHTNNDLFWLENIEKLKFMRRPELRGMIEADLSYLIQSNDIFRIWLKSGLYFNYESLILNYLETLPTSILASERARELIGFLYYRTGQVAKARDFIEGIESPNADSMRGNFDLQEKKYELAFGHFKLALAKKENSHNAIERALPLAWVLEQWDEAHELLNRHILTGLDQKAKDALRAALYIRQGQHQYAQEYLNSFRRKNQDQMPLELEIMQVVNGLMLGSNELIDRSSHRACQRFDGLSCWIQASRERWQNLGRAIERPDSVYTKNRFDINQLKLARTVTPLTEEQIVDQRDIEELDSFDVILIQD